MPPSAALYESAEQWIADLRAAQHSENTVASHAYALRIFLRWLHSEPVVIDLADIDTTRLVNYVKYLKRRRLAHSTIFAYAGVVLRWLQDLINQGELSGIRDHRGQLVTPAGARELVERLLERRETPVAPRIPDLRRLPAYYDAQLQRFLTQRAGQAPANSERRPLRTYLNLLRNRALVATLFSTGGRVNEVLQLDAATVLRGEQVRDAVPIAGKGRKRRPLRLDTTSREWIATYLQVRRAHFPNTAPLFVSHGPNGAGARLSDVTAWRVVKEAAEALADLRVQEGASAAEIEALRAISPHSLRHHLAQAMLDEGADYKDITAVLGHSSTKVTEQFYARLDDERMLEIADTFAPQVVRGFAVNRGNDQDLA